MDLEKRTRMVKVLVVGAGLLAATYMCVGPCTRDVHVMQPEKKVDYANRDAMLQWWQKVPDDIKYSLVEETVMKMPNERLYDLGKSVFGNRFNSDDPSIGQLMKQYLGEKR